MRLKLMDKVYDTREPERIGNFQREYVNNGRRYAVICFPGTRQPKKALMCNVVRYSKPRTYPKNRKPPRTTQASQAYKRLLELKGWTVEECRRRAQSVGLSAVQMLEALTE